MSAREDEIRRVVAELDVHVAEVEAGLAVLKALLAEHDVPDGALDLPDLAPRRGPAAARHRRARQRRSTPPGRLRSGSCSLGCHYGNYRDDGGCTGIPD